MQTYSLSMTTSTDYWGAMYMNIGNNNSGENMRLLFEAILTLETVEECNAFFHDICTIQEMKAMKERFEVARMLDDGLTYVEICKSTGVSSATISRVKTYLEYGADGYRISLERLRKKGVLPPKDRS